MDRQPVAARDLADAEAAAARAGHEPHPWVRHYPPGLDWSLDIEAISIPALFDRSVAKFADKTLIEYRGAQDRFCGAGTRCRWLRGRIAGARHRAWQDGGAVPAEHALALGMLLRHSEGGRAGGPSQPARCPAGAGVQAAATATADMLVSTDLFDLSTKAIDLKHQGKVAEVLIGEDEILGR